MLLELPGLPIEVVTRSAELRLQFLSRSSVHHFPRCRYALRSANPVRSGDWSGRPAADGRPHRMDAWTRAFAALAGANTRLDRKLDDCFGQFMVRVSCSCAPGAQPGPIVGHVHCAY